MMRQPPASVGPIADDRHAFGGEKLSGSALVLRVAPSEAGRYLTVLVKDPPRVRTRNTRTDVRSKSARVGPDDCADVAIAGPATGWKSIKKCMKASHVESNPVAV